MSMKNQTIPISIAVILLLSCTLTIFQVNAQGNIIIVPDKYATIGDAINGATNGDTVLIRKGNYEGPTNQTLIMNKSITLIGESKETTKIHLNPPLVPMYIFTYEYMGYPDALRIEANRTTISGLTIDSPGGNIAINASDTKITDNDLKVGITVTGDKAKIIVNTVNGTISINGNNNTISQSTIGGGIQTTGHYNLIAGNMVSGTSGLYGINSQDNNTVIYNNTLTGSDFQPAIQLGGSSRDNFIAKNNLLLGGLEIAPFTYSNTICGNNLNGDGLGLMGFNNVFYGNQLSHVGIGGTHGGTVDAAYNTFYHNNFVRASPEFQVFTKQPGPLTWDNGYEGNYWSNYTGDGVTPYEVFAEYHYFDGAVREDTNVSLGQDLHPLLTPFDIGSVYIQLPAWAEIALQNSPQPPTLPPTHTSSPSGQKTPTLPIPSNSPSQSSPSLQIPSQQPFPTTFIIAAALAVAIIASLLLLLKRGNERRKLG